MKTPSLTFPNLISQSECRSENVLQLIEERATTCIDTIEQHYGVKIKSIISPVLSNDHGCTFDNEIYTTAEWVKPPKGPAEFVPSGWKRLNDYDFTGYIALTQYNDYYPFDPTIEVWGGELAFKYYGAKIQPTAGNMIVFPTTSNFCYSHLESVLGELRYVKLFFVCDVQPVYDFRLFRTTPFTTIITMQH